MKTTPIVVALLIASALIVGCGQRGPLVKPKPPEPIQKPESKTSGQSTQMRTQ
jgi:predicted small lipoprotein YifL